MRLIVDMSIIVGLIGFLIWMTPEGKGIKASPVPEPPAQCPEPDAPDARAWCHGKNGVLDVTPSGIVDCFRGWV